MDIYIDEANLQSFLSQKANPLFYDCMKLLKKQLNIRFNFSKQRLKDNKDLFLIGNLLSSGVGNTDTSFNNSFPDRPLKSNSAIGFDSEQLSSVYWLNDKDINKTIKSGSVILSEVGNEISSIEQLFFHQGDYLFEKKWRIGNTDFSCWEDLRAFSMPLTDIVFIDNYILYSKEVVDCNIKDYLRVMLDKSFSKVNLVLFVHPDRIDGDIEEYRKDLKILIKTETGKNSNVSIIQTRKEHDRTIITNYKRVYTGDTFNFWDNSGRKITKGREIEYSSFLRTENDNLKKELLDDLQDIINKNPENITGDKASNYLNF